MVLLVKRREGVVIGRSKYVYSLYKNFLLKHLFCASLLPMWVMYQWKRFKNKAKILALMDFILYCEDLCSLMLSGFSLRLRVVSSDRKMTDCRQLPVYNLQTGRSQGTFLLAQQKSQIASLWLWLGDDTSIQTPWPVRGSNCLDLNHSQSWSQNEMESI